MATMPAPFPAAPMPGGAPNPFAAQPAPPATAVSNSAGPDWGPKPDWAVSSNPLDFGKGGLLDQAMLEFVHAEFTLNGPPTYSVPGQVFLYAKLKDLADGVTTHEQWWSCGKQDNILPSGDGEWLLKNPASNADPKINDSTNYALFCATLGMKGYPADKLSFGNAKRIFSGPFGNLMIKTIRVQPEGRRNMKQNPAAAAKAAAGDTRDAIGVLVCDEILKMPWEAAPRKAIASRPGVAAAHQPPPQQAAPPQQTAPPMVAAAAAPAPVAVAAAPAPAPAYAPPPQMAAPPMVPNTPPAGQPAANALPDITDSAQQAQLAATTIATLVDQGGAGGLAIGAARMGVFKSLLATYGQSTINAVVAVADNIPWLTGSGFRVDATTNTIHRA